MDPAIINFISSATPTTIYIVAIWLLWQKLTKMEEKQTMLVDRYHDLLVEQVEVLTKVEEKLNNGKS